MSQTAEYYRILQVRYGANRADVIAAYRRLCKIYHPDINASPGAEEVMKRINRAYDALCKGGAEPPVRGRTEPQSRPAPPPRPEPRTGGAARQRVDTAGAQRCIRGYFAALLSSDYAGAYSLLSDFDRQYVTFQSFCDWRRSVQKLFAMLAFSIQAAGQPFLHQIRSDLRATAVTHTVSITEKSTASHAVESYSVSKLTILEAGGWRVFLGYRDLNEISKIFEDLSMRQERGEMARHWEEYCSHTCRELNMLNLAGFLRQAKAEVYRWQRYKQQMVVACYRVRPVTASPGADAAAADGAARAMARALRETDIAAYLGSGVFVVLFVALRRRHAETITRRVADRLQSGARQALGLPVHADCGHAVYDGGELRTYIDRLSRFGQ